ncbi:hypothetical protein LTSEMIS_5634 [Salmonella enterica subsp. enterica serovar Mississippi str. A4-633]|nr:hypothetical protein LTSEMIS_5634 [Salmonella enterica subsp. enterica serovar Mississippi str. A4-633]
MGGTMPGNLPVASVFGTAMTILSGAGLQPQWYLPSHFLCWGS